MKNKLEWTDLFSGENSFNMVKIDDLPFNEGNFHSYNYQVIYTTMIRNSHGLYKYKMEIQCFILTKDVDYTLCIEILITDYQLWLNHKLQLINPHQRN